PCDRATLRRRARALRADGEPARLLAAAEAAELPDARARGRQDRSWRRQDRRHLRRTGHRYLAADPVEHRWDRADRGAAARGRRRAHLREPRRDRHALGPSQRPGQLPPLPAGLRPPPARRARRLARRRSPDPHLRPRLRPDDALDRPLARARAPAGLRSRPQRRGSDLRGRGVLGRRRDGQCLARRQAGTRASRGADSRAVTAIARYLVDDLDTAVRFYADRLGFREVRSFGPVTIVEREGLELWLSGPGSSGRNQDGAA